MDAQPEEQDLSLIPYRGSSPSAETSVPDMDHEKIKMANEEYKRPTTLDKQRVGNDAKNHGNDNLIDQTGDKNKGENDGDQNGIIQRDQYPPPLPQQYDNRIVTIAAYLVAAYVLWLWLFGQKY
ncbi:hypothetical protein GGS26DRAFT_554643 [Hypomontagnella submonticulosa]|nr:hypothetical protein GGS26DRAFT_554643 [Hypomontagnella submonticulosa]